MRTHKVVVTPDAENWKVELPGLGLTAWSRRIDQVEETAMHAICTTIPMDRERAAIKFNFNVVMANPYIPDPELPTAVICDIDGTLAHANNRGPYDFDKLGTDSLDRPVAELLDLYDGHGVNVILLSGRQEEFRNETETWLAKNLVSYDELHMRPLGDRRGDDLVKMDLFDSNARNRFRVTHVLDDRDRVVHLWRSLGLPCWQVAPGKF